MVTMPSDNAELQLADQFVRDTGCHIFLTGRAGTGKTTFLHALREKSPKRMVVAAPTGVAAINAGGVTLHSFFQLPFGPMLPGGAAARHVFRFSREKRNLIKSLDLLVIDEISMVRADLLDGVDAVLRRVRGSHLPFGGVQLLMIGDLFQLPPVVKAEEWQLLRDHYASPYFFSSAALSQSEMVTIELQHIFRQTDSRFIALLNHVRDDHLDPSALRALNRRHRPDFTPAAGDGYITLCTHNNSADAINASRLAALPEKVRRFEAQVTGDFPEQGYPTTAALELKVGAQVMFVRNDIAPEKRYFNGKIGTIVQIDGADVHIQCPDDSETIAVEPVTWENIAYTLNPDTQEITENKIGTFTQYPLRLAWAITIHKSQGLTFDRAIIDAQAAFAHGQVYVALSRCRTLEGMVLSTSLVSKAIKTDAAVRRFSATAQQQRPSATQLSAAKVRYQQALLVECFDFQHLRGCLRHLVGLLMGNPDIVHVSGIDDIRNLQSQTESEICTVADKFRRQLQGLFSTDTPPSADPVVLDRISKASAYFQDKIGSGIGECLGRIKIETDNQALGKKTRRALQLLGEAVQVKLAAVRSCEGGFSPARYFRALSAAAIETGGKTGAASKAPAATYAEADIEHTELFETLKSWRAQKAKQEGRAHYQVLHQKTLIQIAVNLPDSAVGLKRIKGIGEILAERYGEELVAMVAEYRRRHDIQSVTLPPPPPDEAQPSQRAAARLDTKQITFDLFATGLNIPQIAAKRGLAVSTIEGHLLAWVTAGKVAVDALLAPDKLNLIQQRLDQMPNAPLGEIKRALGDDVSYGEIKLVQAHRKHASG